MTAPVRRIGPREGRLLPQDGLFGPMPWIIAVMMMLATLAAAASLGLSGMARAIGSGAGVSVQIVSADPNARESAAEAALAVLRAAPGIANIRRVPDAEIAASLHPWLGDVAAADIPIPAMIEAEQKDADLAALRAALEEAAPAARLSTSADWLGPLANTVAALRWLAGGLLLFMIAAAGAVVALAARAALDTHRQTIALLHLMGATDRQVARLVERRIAIDALTGSLIGGGAGVALLLFLRDRLAAIGSDLAGTAIAPDARWLFLLLLPPSAALLAMLVARGTVFRALRRSL